MSELTIYIIYSIIFFIIFSIICGIFKFLFDIINIIKNDKVKIEKVNPFDIYKERKGFFLKNILFGYLEIISIISVVPFYILHYNGGKSYSDIRNEEINNVSENLIKKRKLKETKKKIENF